MRRKPQKTGSFWLRLPQSRCFRVYDVAHPEVVVQVNCLHWLGENWGLEIFAPVKRAFQEGFGQSGLRGWGQGGGNRRDFEVLFHIKSASQKSIRLRNILANFASSQVRRPT